MCVMKELSDQYKLSVRSIAEVFSVLNDIDSRYGRSGRISFRGKRLTREGVVNAAIAYLGSLNDNQMEVALALGVTLIEKSLADNEREKMMCDLRIAATAERIKGNKGNLVREYSSRPTSNDLATMLAEDQVEPEGNPGPPAEAAQDESAPTLPIPRPPRGPKVGRTTDPTTGKDVSRRSGGKKQKKGGKGT